MPTIRLGPCADVPEGSGRTFVAGGRHIAVFCAEGNFYAIDDKCSHADASLGAGEFDPDTLCVACPRHGASFDVRSGAVRSLPAFKPVASYRVVVDEAILFVECPD
ncbi:MAG: non-heme iron oxygenase ferredoxin subunit [Candidatus Viridilinea halotolerans]|uniref:Non-heme iron oxygenase ferredoxin subunit n=1 Tax=Candidatus Viridilinea halotolerans TaxID=2491704 RepID=A0A426U2E8_9CHLR|nr:MAG: non-heme iron oxygenase ferredoxin subunit [Candidatus Viridilinea halotolerans]